MAIGVRIGVRTVLLVLAWVAYSLVTEARAPLGEPGLGLRLIGIALLASAAALWAAIDGRRGTPLDVLLICWAVVTVIAAVFVPVWRLLRAGAPTMGVLSADLIVVTPLVGAVIFGSAAIAGAAGTMSASRRRSQRRQLPPYG